MVSYRMLQLFKRKEDKDFSALWLLPGALMISLALFVKADRRAIETLCGLMCIIAIGGLASMKTARQGCFIGISAVFSAVACTLLSMHPGTAVKAVMFCTAPGLILGGLIGKVVDPIKLPQTVAAFHSLVGLAAMVTSIGNFAETQKTGFTMENVFGLLGDLIGGITLTGSIIAFLKLDGRMSSTAWDLPGKNLINIGSLGGFLFPSFIFVKSDSPTLCIIILWLVAALACWMGVHLVASVGGGDMPVCITVLNSYSGWALVSEGFMLQNSMLTIVGSLIGFSGAILTHIMCVAMNRDIANVLFGGMNNAAPIKTGTRKHPRSTRRSS